MDRNEPLLDTEKRHPIICANCNVQMVCMNLYIISNYHKIYVRYICPRRKENNENGCGHETLIEIKRTSALNEGLDLDFRLIGEVRSSDKITMIIQDNLETFDSWLHHNRERFKNKKVELTLRIIDNNPR